MKNIKLISILSVLYSHLVDGVGHKYGFGLHIPEYVKAIEAVDTCIGDLLKKLENRKNEDWLICLITDHGGTARTSMPFDMKIGFDSTPQYHKGVSQLPLKGIHGMNIPQHRNIFFCLAGANLQAGEILPAPRQIDLVPTILHHLGCVNLEEFELDGQVVGLRDVMQPLFDEDLVSCLCCVPEIGSQFNPVLVCVTAT